MTSHRMMMVTTTVDYLSYFVVYVFGITQQPRNADETDQSEGYGKNKNR